MKTMQKSLALATQNEFRHVMLECHKVPPATRNEDTGRLKPPKVTTFAELTRGSGMAITTTVADSCKRLRTQTHRRTNTPSAPKPPE